MTRLVSPWRYVAAEMVPLTRYTLRHHTASISRIKGKMVVLDDDRLGGSIVW